MSVHERLKQIFESMEDHASEFPAGHALICRRLRGRGDGPSRYPKTYHPDCFISQWTQKHIPGAIFYTAQYKDRGYEIPGLEPMTLEDCDGLEANLRATYGKAAELPDQ